MRIGIVNVNKSRISRNFEYHLFTIKGFIDDRSHKSFETEIVDVFMTDNITTSANMIQNSDFDLILFRMIYWNSSYILRLLNVFNRGKALVGVWGHDTFSHPEEYLKKEFDFIIQDEPELSLFEVASLTASGDDLSKAAGIVFRDDNKKSFVFGENRVVNDLDMIPSPYLNGLVNINSDTLVFWEVARGCLFRCDFCVDFSHSNNLRYHSFGYLEKELKLFAEKEVSEITIGSPVFNLNHQYMEKLLDLINKYLPDTYVDIQVRPDLLTRQEIEVISEMNVYLNFGLQTINQKVHENLMTSLNIENSIANIRYMNNFPNIPFGIDLVAGLPKMSYDDFLNDLETAFNLWPININVYRLSMYPGTRIFNRKREFDYKVENSYPYRVAENPLFSKREFEKVDEISWGIDLIYNRGRMVSILPMMAKALEMPSWDIILRWNKWVKKQYPDLSEDVLDDIEYSQLFDLINEYFGYLFERFQKKKLWNLAEDILKHNHFYTMSLMTPVPDKITFPYQLTAISPDTEIGINESAFFEKFSYDIEDIVDTGFIDIKKYNNEVDKENLCGLVYRLDGGIITRTISEEDYNFFKFISKKKKISLSALSSKFKNYDLFEMVSYWCDEGVLFLY